MKSTVFVLSLIFLVFSSCSSKIPTSQESENIPTNQDCNGDIDGAAYENECGCVGGNTGIEPDFCYGCTDSIADNYEPTATINDGNCLYHIDIHDLITANVFNYERTNVRMEFWLENRGSRTAYNVRYRIAYHYKCQGQITGSPTYKWTDVIMCCDIAPGEKVHLYYEVFDVCVSNGGMIEFGNEIDYIAWD